MSETTMQLIQLSAAVSVALGLRLYNKYVKKSSPEDLIEEARQLLLPSLMVGLAAFASTSDYMVALTSTLTTLGVALGINTSKVKK